VARPLQSCAAAFLLGLSTARARDGRRRPSPPVQGRRQALTSHSAQSKIPVTSPSRACSGGSRDTATRHSSCRWWRPPSRPAAALPSRTGGSSSSAGAAYLISIPSFARSSWKAFFLGEKHKRQRLPERPDRVGVRHRVGEPEPEEPHELQPVLDQELGTLVRQ
jgi:hypothetical protein